MRRARRRGQADEERGWAKAKCVHYVDTGPLWRGTAPRAWGREETSGMSGARGGEGVRGEWMQGGRGGVGGAGEPGRGGAGARGEGEKRREAGG